MTTLVERLQELVDLIDFDHYGKSKAEAGIIPTIEPRDDKFYLVNYRQDGSEWNFPTEFHSYLDAWRYLAQQLEDPDGYQVGRLDENGDGDPTFDSLNAALEHALDQSGIETDPNHIGIWAADDDAELLYVAVGGVLFSKYV